MKIPSVTRVLSLPLLLAIAGCAHKEYKFADYPPQPANPSYQGAASTPSAAITGTSSDSSASSSSQMGSTSQTGATAAAGATDNDLASQVRQALQGDTTVASVIPNLQISANSGTVTITGTVNSEEQKQSIESIIKQTSGVVSVDDQLQVSSQAGLGMNNQDFATSGVSTNTNNLQNLDSGSTITPTSRADQPASVYGNTAEPGATGSDSGTAAQQQGATSGQDLSATGNLAPGNVGSIHVAVQGSNDADQNVAQKITQELQADTPLAGALQQVNIVVNNGNVALQGAVKSDQQKRDIENAIRHVIGVSSVDNQLQVSSDQSLPNQ